MYGQKMVGYQNYRDFRHRNEINDLYSVESDKEIKRPRKTQEETGQGISSINQY